MSAFKWIALFFSGFTLGFTLAALVIGVMLANEPGPADWNQITKIEAATWRR